MTPTARFMSNRAKWHSMTALWLFANVEIPFCIFVAFYELQFKFLSYFWSRPTYELSSSTDWMVCISVLRFWYILYQRSSNYPRSKVFKFAAKTVHKLIDCDDYPIICSTVEYWRCIQIPICDAGSHSFHYMKRETEKIICAPLCSELSPSPTG